MFRVQSKNIYQGLASNNGISIQITTILGTKIPCWPTEPILLGARLANIVGAAKSLGGKNLSYESLGPGSRYKVDCNPYKWPKIVGLAESLETFLGEFFHRNLVMIFQESSSCLTLEEKRI